jgi:hypothetical protein
VCTAVEAFAFLFAALCVDVDHNGVDNSYHRKQGTPIAVQCMSMLVMSGKVMHLTLVLVHNSSVLEHHHAAVAWNLLNDADIEILAALTATEARSVQTTVNECILGMLTSKQAMSCDLNAVKFALATDWMRHPALLTRLTVWRCLPFANALSVSTCARTKTSTYTSFRAGLTSVNSCLPACCTRPTCV